MTDVNNVLEMNKQVELGNGTVVNIPRLTNKKVLQLSKFVAGDGLVMYSQFADWREENTEKEPAYDEDGVQKTDEDGNLLFNYTGPKLEDAVDKILEIVPDEKLLEIIAILINVPNEQVADMDFFDTALIIGGFLEATPIDRLVKVVKKVADKFRKPAKEELKQAAQPATQQTTPPNLTTV